MKTLLTHSAAALLIFLFSCGSNNDDVEIVQVSLSSGNSYELCFNKPVTDIGYELEIITNSGTSVRKEYFVYSTRNRSEEKNTCHRTGKMQLRPGAYNHEEQIFYRDSLIDGNIKQIRYKLFSSSDLSANEPFKEGIIEF